MNVDLRTDLVRTLSAAATAAPEPEGDFAAGISRRRRRIQRIRVAGVAAVAVVIVAVSGAVAAVGLRGDPTANVDPAASSAAPSGTPSGTPSASVAPDATIDLSTVPPADQVWPEAVQTLPVALPDGRKVAHRYVVDDDRLLVVPGTATMPYLLPVVFNRRTGQTQELMGGQTGRSFLEASVGERNILVIVAVDGGTDRELWVAPKTGGPAVKRTRFDAAPPRKEGQPAPPAPVTSPFEVGDVLFVSFDTLGTYGPDEVRRVRADGSLEKEPGTEGWMMAARPTPPPWLAKDRGAALWNLATGERRTPRPLGGLESFGCTAQACVGRDSDGSVVTSRWDGGGRHLRATGLPSADASTLDLIFDSSGRFLQVRTETHSYLWDLQTNRAGRVDSLMALDDGLMTLDETERVIVTALIR